MLFVEPKGEPRRVAVHDGAILATAADNKRIVSGGDDGKVVDDRRQGRNPHARHRSETPLDRSRRARAGRGRRLVGRQDGVRAGQNTARIRGALDRRRRLPSCQRVSGLPSPTTTAPRSGFRTRQQAAPEMLEWKGSHLGATVSPDGRFLVTAMQEPMLHGWRLADRKHMRMSGYAARVTSLGWSDGRRLARDIGRAAAHPLAVPEQRRPDGQGAARAWRRLSIASKPSPAIPGRRSSLPAMPMAWCCLCASRTAPRFWPRNPGNAPVTALAWSADGRFLAFGTEERRGRRARSRLNGGSQENPCF